MTSARGQNSSPTGASVRCSGAATAWGGVGERQGPQLLVGRRRLGNLTLSSAVQSASRCRAIPERGGSV